MIALCQLLGGPNATDAKTELVFYLATAKSLKDGLSFPHLLNGENNSSALLWWLRVLKEIIQRALSTEPNG